MQQKDDMNRILARWTSERTATVSSSQRTGERTADFYDLFMDEALDINPNQLIRADGKPAEPVYEWSTRIVTAI